LIGAGAEHVQEGFEAAHLPTMRATQFPCVEDILYFGERETIVSNGLWHVDISVQPESSTLIFEGEK
jgi:hypothetical protein